MRQRAKLFQGVNILPVCRGASYCAFRHTAKPSHTGLPVPHNRGRASTLLQGGMTSNLLSWIILQILGNIHGGEGGHWDSWGRKVVTILHFWKSFWLIFVLKRCLNIVLYIFHMLLFLVIFFNFDILLLNQQILILIRQYIFYT